MRNAYYTQHYLTSTGAAAVYSASQTHRLLSATSQAPSLSAVISKSAHSAQLPATLRGTIAALFPSLGRLLSHTNDSSFAPTSPPSSPPPELGNITTSETPGLGEAAFSASFFATISSNLSVYASAQCADGYTGRVCAVCAHGYGLHGVATCKPCSRLNSLYYALALLLTLAFLAWTFHSTLSYSHSQHLARHHAQREGISGQRDIAQFLKEVSIRVLQPAVQPHTAPVNLAACTHDTCQQCTACAFESVVRGSGLDGVQAEVNSCESVPHDKQPAVEDNSATDSLIASGTREQIESSEHSSCVELETKTSYFSDTRDPVIEDSKRAAMVVTRIFLSYLQVRDGGRFR